jgi:hypothetical protein
MNIWSFGALCLVCLIACFCLAGLEFNEGKWSPAAIVLMSMLFSAIIGSLFTIFVLNTI